jgi:hypothetical protein
MKTRGSKRKVVSDPKNGENTPTPENGQNLKRQKSHSL